MLVITSIQDVKDIQDGPTHGTVHTVDHDGELKTMHIVTCNPTDGVIGFVRSGLRGATVAFTIGILELGTLTLYASYREAAFAKVIRTIQSWARSNKAAVK